MMTRGLPIVNVIHRFCIKKPKMTVPPWRNSKIFMFVKIAQAEYSGPDCHSLMNTEGVELCGVVNGSPFLYVSIYVSSYSVLRTPQHQQPADWGDGFCRRLSPHACSRSMWLLQLGSESPPRERGERGKRRRWREITSSIPIKRNKFEVVAR